jgi:hypothetical protein
MKNTIKVFGIIALTAVIWFSMAACEEEKKYDGDFNLNYLPGTWKTTAETPDKKTDVTVVFSNVINGKTTMTLSGQTVIKSGESGSGGGSGGGSGYWSSGEFNSGHPLFDGFINLIFGTNKGYQKGIKQKYPGGRSTTDADDVTYVWERDYTQEDIRKLHWSLRTLQGDAELTISYLIPAGECDCENCVHFDLLFDSSNCCSDPYCGKNPQGNLAALLNREPWYFLTFKKQK